MYLVFLVILGLPVMVMEFSVGRASQRSTATAFNVLQPKGKWLVSWWGYIGCILLMMFYTTVCGWFLNYIVKMATGTFVGHDADGGGRCSADAGRPVRAHLLDAGRPSFGFLVCAAGLQKGVERVTKS